MTARLRAVFAAIPTSAIKAFLCDALFIGGFAIACYGIALIYPPAAWIFGGLALSVVVFLGTKEPVGPDE